MRYGSRLLAPRPSPYRPPCRAVETHRARPEARSSPDSVRIRGETETSVERGVPGVTKASTCGREGPGIAAAPLSQAETWRLQGSAPAGANPVSLVNPSPAVGRWCCNCDMAAGMLAELLGSGTAVGRLPSDLPLMPLPPGGETHAFELVGGAHCLPLPLPPLPLPPLPLPPFWRLLDPCLHSLAPCPVLPHTPHA